MELEREEQFNKEEVVIVGKSEEYTETERNIAYTYAAVLNLKEIDVYGTFNSMGGNSILATHLLKIIETQYPGIVDISDIFTYSTVIELSQYIDKKMGISIKDINKKDVIKESEKEFSELEFLELLYELEEGSTSVEEVMESLNGCMTINMDNDIEGGQDE